MAMYINGVITDTNGCMKMEMATAISVATANDESVGLVLCLIYFPHPKTNKQTNKKTFLPQHKGLHHFLGKMIK